MTSRIIKKNPRMRLRAVSGFCFFVIPLLVVMLCNCAATDPHENFKRIMSRAVGKNLSDGPSLTHALPNRLVSTEILSNGNILNTYLYRRTCYYMLEIDKSTQIILGVTHKGTKQDCAIIPV